MADSTEASLEPIYPVQRVKPEEQLSLVLPLEVKLAQEEPAHQASDAG